MKLSYSFRNPDLQGIESLEDSDSKEISKIISSIDWSKHIKRMNELKAKGNPTHSPRLFVSLASGRRIFISSETEGVFELFFEFSEKPPSDKILRIREFTLSGLSRKDLETAMSLYFEGKPNEIQRLVGIRGIRIEKTKTRTDYIGMSSSLVPEPARTFLGAINNAVIDNILTDKRARLLYIMCALGAFSYRRLDMRWWDVLITIFIFWLFLATGILAVKEKSVHLRGGRFYGSFAVVIGYIFLAGSVYGAVSALFEDGIPISSANVDVDEVEKGIISAINEERRLNGLDEYKKDSYLSAITEEYLEFLETPRRWREGKDIFDLMNDRKVFSWGSATSFSQRGITGLETDGDVTKSLVDPFITDVRSRKFMLSRGYDSIGAGVSCRYGECYASVLYGAINPSSTTVLSPPENQALECFFYTIIDNSTEMGFLVPTSLKWESNESVKAYVINFERGSVTCYEETTIDYIKDFKAGMEGNYTYLAKRGDHLMFVINRPTAMSTEMAYNVGQLVE